MSAAANHLVHRSPKAKWRPRLPEARQCAPCNLPRPDRRFVFERAALRLFHTPLSDPVAILLKMPAQAVMPALLEALGLVSSRVLFFEYSPTGEWREAAALP